MIIFTTYFIYWPDVTCGHFWKGSFGGGYKIYIFLWEARLLSTIRKTNVETDFTSYFFLSAKNGHSVSLLLKVRSIQILSSISTLALFMLGQKIIRLVGEKINIGFSLYWKCKLFFPKNWLFSKETVLSIRTEMVRSLCTEDEREYFHQSLLFYRSPQKLFFMQTHLPKFPVRAEII